MITRKLSNCSLDLLAAITINSERAVDLEGAESSSSEVNLKQVT